MSFAIEGELYGARAARLSDIMSNGYCRSLIKKPWADIRRLHVFLDSYKGPYDKIQAFVIRFLQYPLVRADTT